MPDNESLRQACRPCSDLGGPHYWRLGFVGFPPLSLISVQTSRLSEAGLLACFKVQHQSCPLWVIGSRCLAGKAIKIPQRRLAASSPGGLTGRQGPQCSSEWHRCVNLSHHAAPPNDPKKDERFSFLFFEVKKVCLTLKTNRGGNETGPAISALRWAGGRKAL